MEIGASNSAQVAQLATEARQTQSTPPQPRESASLATAEQSPPPAENANTDSRVGGRIDTFA